MKKWMGFRAVRITAFLLALILSCLCLLSAFGVLYLYENGGYTGRQFLENSLENSSGFIEYMELARCYYEDHCAHQGRYDPYDSQWEEQYRESLTPASSNFYFLVLDENGKMLFSGGQGSVSKDGVTDFGKSRYLARREMVFSQRWEEKSVEQELSFDTEEAMWNYINRQYERPDTCGFGYEVLENGSGKCRLAVSYTEFKELTRRLVGYIREDMTARDSLYHLAQLLMLLTNNRDTMIVAAAVSGVLALLLVIFLFCAVGHRPGAEGIVLSGFDKIPLDILALACFLICGSLIACIEGRAGVVRFLLILCATLLPAAALALAFFLSFAVRIKAGGWWRNSLIYWLFSKIRNGLVYAVKNLPLYWKAGLILGGVAILELLVIAGSSPSAPGFVLLCWFFEKLLMAVAVIVGVVNFKKLRDGAKALAQGNLSRQIDTDRMLPTFRAQADDLNAVSQGMQKAVEARTRSERMKAELITNVSHDIKTPLTSIVNYVDLLKKENIQEPKAKEYLEVLERQSARLKKLTEDLVEASKASSGTLVCNPELTDLNVLLGQVLGEYEGRLQELKLEPVLRLDENAPVVMADGRLLWRVFDNLLGNVCKYALSGTRVYVTCQTDGGFAEITFKNISRSTLNISAEELMERFVRGDRSRSTEGSGLGLSIARSLVELQKGVFSLIIDGDLFKAYVKLPLAETVGTT